MSKERSLSSFAAVGGSSEEEEGKASGIAACLRVLLPRHSRLSIDARSSSSPSSSSSPAFHDDDEVVEIGGSSEILFLVFVFLVEVPSSSEATAGGGGGVSLALFAVLPATEDGCCGRDDSWDGCGCSGCADRNSASWCIGGGGEGLLPLLLLLFLLLRWNRDRFSLRLRGSLLPSVEPVPFVVAKTSGRTGEPRVVLTVVPIPGVGIAVIVVKEGVFVE